MNSKIVLSKRTSAIFLAIVLVTGIFALSYPSFMTEAQATSDREKHNDDDDRKSYKKDRDKNDSRDHGKDNDRKSYGKDNSIELIIDNTIDNKYGKPYENDNDYYESQYQSSPSYKSNYYYKPEYSSYEKPYYQLDYKPAYSSYGKKDNNNNYKSTKDSSSSNSINVNKIKCNNINLNINNGQGNNNGNTNNGNNGNGDNSNDERNKTNNGFKKFNKKDGFEFVCVNNNDNRQITPTPPPTPPSPINNNVYVVWVDNTDIIPGINEIFFAVSNDNGQTFSTPKNISKTLQDSFNPQITSEGDNVYVVWEEGPFNNSDIFFTVSTDGGKTFSTPDNLSDSGEDSSDPQLSIEGDNVYVVWEEGSSGNREIFFAVSNNNGQTFSTPPNNLSDNEEDSIDPQISSTGNNVYVVWRDFSISNNDIIISFASSDDNGQNFSTPPDNLSGDGRSFDPQISSEGDNVYVVWATHIESDGHEDIFFTVSNNNGQTFDTPENISENPEQSGLPQISTEGNNVYVVWQDENEENDVFIFFVVSNDNGENFSTPPDNLSENIRLSERPQISSEGDNVYVVWQGSPPFPGEIFFAGSNDNGENFSTPPDNLSDNDGGSFGPQISSEGNNVYVVWTDNSAGNDEIFFAVSNNNGQTFSTPPNNLSENNGQSFFPQISSSTS